MASHPKAPTSQIKEFGSLQPTSTLNDLDNPSSPTVSPAGQAANESNSSRSATTQPLEDSSSSDESILTSSSTEAATVSLFNAKAFSVEENEPAKTNEANEANETINDSFEFSNKANESINEAKEAINESIESD